MRRLLLALSAVAICYLLGWLKLLYYFQAFAIDLSQLDLSPADVLVESWFVVQNVLFFVLLWWIVIKTRLAWIAVVAGLHALLPIASHYAFSFAGQGFADGLIAYRHTLLKLIPFAVLIAVWAFYPRLRATLRDPSWPHGKAALAVFLIVILSWSLSTAKHSGSYDAVRAMRWPDEYLIRVRVHPVDAGGIPGIDRHDQTLYLVYADERSYILWDRPGNEVEAAEDLRLISVPRSAVASLEGHRPYRVQLGRRFL